MKKKTSLARIIACLALVLCLPMIIGNGAFADSYTYDVYDNPVPAPDAYEWCKSIRAEDVGVDNLASINDVVFKDGKIYIALNGKVLVLDEEFKLLKDIRSYVINGEDVAVTEPKGIFVTDNGDIYITEEAKGLIIHLDSDGKFIRSIGDPHVRSLKNITFQPTKVVIDDIGRIYVKAKSVYEGIMELNPNGEFNRFIGANEVSPSLIQRFYRMIATEEQISKMELWLPTDYSDITLDAEGYILATVKGTKQTQPIRKLNAAGVDVMSLYEYISAPLGDYTGKVSNSVITNITAAEDGRFAALDINMTRVFVYAPDGILLYVIGGQGKKTGNLNSPVDIEFMHDYILVPDLVTCSIEVFRPTEYGELINQALKYEYSYDYNTAAEYWTKVYNISATSIAANMGLGKQALRAENYDAAAEYFKRTGERKSYSLAFERIRNAWMDKYLGTLIIILLLAIIAINVLKKKLIRLDRQGKFEGNKFVAGFKKFKYTAFTWPKYMMSSPFKAFDDIKYYNDGSTVFAVILLLLYSWLKIFDARYSGFLLNFGDPSKINIPLIMTAQVCPILIFVVANWAVGVLIDGKGTLNSIFKVTMYSFYPYIWLKFIGVLLSRICIYEETNLIRTMYIIGYVLFAFYLFVGLVMVHQFSFLKTVGDLLITVVAMIIVIFITVLLVSLVTGFTNDIGTIVDEMKLYL